MVDISSDSHLQCPCEGFEDTFYLVVLVLSFCLDIQIDTGSIRERLEEMQEHLGRHLSHPLMMELGIPYQPWAPSEVKGHLTEAVIHRQTEAIALNATLVAQCLKDALAQGNSSILNGMMLIHLQITFRMDEQIDIAVLGDLFEHVVKESQSCAHITLACTIKSYTHVDISFLCRTTHLCQSFTGKQQFCNTIP